MENIKYIKTCSWSAGNAFTGITMALLSISGQLRNAGSLEILVIKNGKLRKLQSAQKFSRK